MFINIPNKSNFHIPSHTLYKELVFLTPGLGVLRSVSVLNERMHVKALPLRRRCSRHLNIPFHESSPSPSRSSSQLHLIEWLLCAKNNAKCPGGYKDEIKYTSRPPRDRHTSCGAIKKGIIQAQGHLQSRGFAERAGRRGDTSRTRWLRARLQSLSISHILNGFSASPGSITLPLP